MRKRQEIQKLPRQGNVKTQENMEKEYYIVVNDRREGPFSFEGLRARGIEPTTLVWTAGMSDWKRAADVTEVAPLLASQSRINENESAFGGYSQRQEPPRHSAYGGADPRYGQRRGDVNPQVQVNTNWKTLAIVALVCGFLFSCIGGIVGIFAVIQGSKAENAQRYGNDVEAANCWSNCKTLTIISFVLAGIGVLANVALLKYMPLGVANL